MLATPVNRPLVLGQALSAASVSIVQASDAVNVTGGITINPIATFTRPADVTAYSIGDLVANSVTAGSVTPLSLACARIAAGSFVIHRLKLAKSSIGLTNASFRVHLFRAAPTVVNGDNGALSMTGVGNYLGGIDISIDQAFSDGAAGFSSLSMIDVAVKLTSGSTLFALLEARAAYTPGSAESFTLTAETLQD